VEGTVLLPRLDCANSRLIRWGILLAAAGVTMGRPAALALSHLTQSFLYGLEPSDLLTIGMAVFALSVAGWIAAYLQARRATDEESGCRFEA
jgi:hypothetical protein